MPMRQGVTSLIAARARRERAKKGLVSAAFSFGCYKETCRPKKNCAYIPPGEEADGIASSTADAATNSACAPPKETTVAFLKKAGT